MLSHVLSCCVADILLYCIWKLIGKRHGLMRCVCFLRHTVMQSLPSSYLTVEGVSVDVAETDLTGHCHRKDNVYEAPPSLDRDQIAHPLLSHQRPNVPCGRRRFLCICLACAIIIIVGVVVGDVVGRAAPATSSQCPHLDSPLHGFLIGQCSGNRQGDVCTYSCDTGFVLGVNDQLKRTCQQDGTYSGSANTCRPVQCPTVSAPANGSVSGICVGSFGGTCLYACNIGFALSSAGEKQRTCQQDGTYSGMARLCEPVTCAALSPPLHGGVASECNGRYGDVCMITCSEGYFQSTTGVAAQTCGQAGAYNGTTKTYVKTHVGNVTLTGIGEGFMCGLLNGVVRIHDNLDIISNPGLTKLHCFESLLVGNILMRPSCICHMATLGKALTC